MALSISRDDTFINKASSGYMFGKEVESTGENLATPDSIHTFGRVQKSVYNKAATQTKEKDQGGVEVVVSTEIAASFEYTIMQRDKEHIDLPETMEGRYVSFIQEMTAKVIGASKIQYLVVAAATPEPTVNIDGSDMYVKHKWTCYPYSGEDDLTISYTVSGTFGSQTVAGTLEVGDYHAVIEITKA